MYYPDLSCYRIDDCEGDPSTVYSGLKNVGWLDINFDYEKGDIPNHLVQKLKELLFFYFKNIDDEKNGSFDPYKAIVVEANLIRGSAYKCNLCEENQVISVEPNELKYYSGKKSALLGVSDIQIPSLKEKEYYISPTMLYHYVVVHRYKPPQEFLDALESFDLDRPFNINIEGDGEKAFQIPKDEVNYFNPELDIHKYEEFVEEDYDEDEDD